MTWEFNLSPIDPNLELPTTDGPKLPIPDGKYKGVFTEASIESRTNAKGIEYVGGPVTFQVTDGPETGYEIRTFFILAHGMSDIAHQKGQRLLRQWQLATKAPENIGQHNIGELLMRPVTVNVTTQEGNTRQVQNRETGQMEDRTYAPRNRIEAIDFAAGVPASGLAPAQSPTPAPQPPAPAAQAAPAQSSMPWQR